MTRAEVTHETELTAQSISRIVDSLTDQGFLTLGKKVPHGRGQPSSQLSIQADAAFGVGLSIMTDAISGTVMDLAGNIIAKDWLRLTSVNIDSILEDCRILYDRLLEQSGAEHKRVAGVGAGVTGYFIGQGRQLNPPEPLDALAMVEIDHLLAETLQRPVWVDNDGNVAAMGEALTGAGQRYATFGYIFFAMGVGGAVVINGQVFPGAFGNAGEFGGVLPPEGHEERPTLELLRRMIARHGPAPADIYEMIRDFRMETPGVEDWIAHSLPKLNAIVSAVAAVLDPEAIVLGGRIPKALAARLAQDITFYSMPRRGIAKPFPELVISEVQGDAAAIGAAATPLKARFFS